MNGRKDTMTGEDKQNNTLRQIEKCDVDRKQTALKAVRMCDLMYLT